LTLRDEETDGRRRVRTVEERVEREGWTEIRSLRSGENFIINEKLCIY